MKSVRSKTGKSNMDSRMSTSSKTHTTPSPEPTFDIISALTRKASLVHILEHIWSLLDWRTLRRATLVCHSWNEILKDESLWQEMIMLRARHEEVFQNHVRRFLLRFHEFNDKNDDNLFDA